VELVERPDLTNPVEVAAKGSTEVAGSATAYAWAPSAMRVERRTVRNPNRLTALVAWR
jgi:hypothetical protein